MLLFALALAHAAPSEAPAPPVRPVEVARVDGAHVQRPLWSPDGRLLAWEANDHESKQITLHVGPPEGPFARVAPPASPQSAFTMGFTAAGRAPGVTHDLCWSPVAPGAYVYAATGPLDDYDLYVAGGAALAPAPGADGGAAWSPDGRRLVFTSARTGDGDLYLLDLQAVTSSPRRLTRTPGAAELFPAWSPDGRALAFVGHVPGGDTLWLLRDLQGEAIPVAHGPGTRSRPSWSPDGSLLAWHQSTDGSGRFDLVVAEPRVGAPTRVLLRGVLPGATGPSWTPDGRTLVVVRDDDAALDPIVAVPVDGGPVRPLDLGTVGHGDLDLVARDGRLWIAWVAQGQVNDEVRDFKRLYVAPLALPGR